MKIRKKTIRAIACFILLGELFLAVLQFSFLLVKLFGELDWSWWTVSLPLFLMLTLPFAITTFIVLALIPFLVAKEIKQYAKLNQEAKRYGMERVPGETSADLKKRIVRRNMIEGNFSRKDIKDEILKAFPYVGSCRIFVNNHTQKVTLFLRDASGEWHDSFFTDDELREITEFAAQYIPASYKITAINDVNKSEEMQQNDNNKA